MKKINASFRDPDGFVYYEHETLFRKVNPSGFSNYDLLMQSQLYDALVKKKLLIPHEEVSRDATGIILKPEQLPFISYPYEWCFSQYKDAALLTLTIQAIALNHGMSLKDASAYNVQFHHGKPIFIDTLSFEKLDPTQPWAAYRQFCQHFLSVIALMAYTDIRLNKMMMTYIDGLPLDLATGLLPYKTKFKLGLYLHLHLHAKYQHKYKQHASSVRPKTSLLKLKAMIDFLTSTVKKIHLPKIKTTWGEYYSFTNYEAEAFSEKKRIISDYITAINPATLVDLGANDGSLTRLASQKNILSIASDMDPIAVEKNYLAIKKQQEKNLLPLIQDLTNPSADIGWHHYERDRFISRMKAECALALALVHHLAISNNLSLEQIARFFSELSPYLIIEFVPKTDSKVKELLSTRPDIFPHYTLDGFEAAFSQEFITLKKEKIKGTERTLYMMQKIG